MWSLPAFPEQSKTAAVARTPKASRLDPTNNIITFVPPVQDAYTGLIRADFYGRASSWFYWWIPETERMILTHGMKTKKVCPRFLVHNPGGGSYFFRSIWKRKSGLTISGYTPNGSDRVHIRLGSGSRPRGCIRWRDRAVEIDKNDEIHNTG